MEESGVGERAVVVFLVLMLDVAVLGAGLSEGLPCWR